jgi:hypothetical protein
MLMKKALVLTLVLFGLGSGTVFAQQFTATPRRVAPQPIPPRPAVEQEGNNSVINKIYRAPNKLQVISPFAPASYGSGQEVVVAADYSTDPRERPRFWRLFSISF